MVQMPGRVIAAIFEPLQPVEQPLRDFGSVADDSDDSAHGRLLAFFLGHGRSRKRAAQPASCFCSARATPSASASTSRVTTEPAPTIAPRRSDRRHQRAVGADEGALADHRRIFEEAVIIAGDGAGADVGARADLGIADIGSGDWPWRRAEPRLLDLDEIADLRLSRRCRRRGGAGHRGRSRRPRRRSRLRGG
jgi:hypothetical protein